jgi:acetyltransferase-like isoleucine patch superfamily enzyme
MDLHKIAENKIGIRTIIKSSQAYFKGKAGADKRGRGTLLIDGATKLSIEKNARIINRGCLSMGLKTKIFHPSTNPCMLMMGHDSKLVINGNVDIGKGTSIIIMPGGCLELGNNAYINGDSSILCATNIKIGENTTLSWDVEVSDTDHHRIIRDGSVTAAPIEIGNKVLIGRRSMVMKGVKIGDGAVIAAGAIVTRDVPSACLAAGVPARVIREKIDWQ